MGIVGVDVGVHEGQRVEGVADGRAVAGAADCDGGAGVGWRGEIGGGGGFGDGCHALECIGRQGLVLATGDVLNKRERAVKGEV